MSQLQDHEFLTPVGRLIMGSTDRPNDKDADGNPLVYKTGKNAGQPRVQYFIGLAIPKTSPDWPAFYQRLQEQAKKLWPTVPDVTGPAFSLKVVDGDSNIPTQTGRIPCQQENYPGNWIVKISNGFAPKCFDQNGEDLPAEGIKRGYYIRVLGTVASNNSNQKPGIFLNGSSVQLLAFGEVINSGPDSKAIFEGNAVGALPAGASAVPLASEAVIPPAVPGAPVAPAIPAVTPAAVGQVPAPAAVVPDVNFPNPPAATPPPPPAPEAEKTYTVSGKQFTKAQLLASGWTEAQIAGLN